MPQTNVATSKPAPKPEPKIKTASFQELINAGEEKANQLSKKINEKTSASSDSGYSSYSVDMSSIARDKPVNRSSNALKPRSVKLWMLFIFEISFCNGFHFKLVIKLVK